jgi:signal transduction histidine kinase
MQMRPGDARRWLPRSAPLSEADWHSRHRVVELFLAAHVAVLPVYAALRHVDSWQAWAGIATITAASIAAWLPLPRRARMIGATIALLTASGVVIILAGGASYPAFHVLLGLTLIALYEDWPTYLFAVGYVVAQHVLAIPFTPASLQVDGTPPWRPAVVHGFLVLLSCATLVVFWHYLEQGRARASEANDELFTGRETLREQMDELAQTREQLVATVSHEFRTPLTAIRGSALTLRRRRDRLDAERTNDLLDGIVANTDRLSRLLENMLAAAEVPDSDGWDVADVHEVATEVAMVVHGRHAAAPEKGQERPQPVAVAVPRRLHARIDRTALHQVLANLVDNALVHSATGSQALLTAVTDGTFVVITVANEAHGIDAATLAALFEPFTLGDASDTRSRAGAGVGLYVVRRLVDAAGGTVSVHSEPGWVSIEVRLPAAEAPRATTLVDLTAHTEPAAPPASA